MVKNDPRFGGYFPPFPLNAGRKHLESVENVLHRRVDVAMWYQWWDTGFPIPRKARDFQPQWLAQANGRDVLIKWEPWKPGRQILQPRFAVGTITAGHHDCYICRWINQIRKCGQTVHLCPLPEPNGFWHGWSATVGGHEPGVYVEAWRHIHELFMQEGATNVRWVWNPNAGDMPDENRMELYYPGNDVVDVLGLSVYNWGTARPWSRWRSFEEIIKPYYDRITALGSQPVWVAEMGCAPEGGDRAAWIREMFDYLPELPRLDTLVWFDAKKETDWRITNDPAISSLFHCLEEGAATA